jgi:hypothetical protein
MSVATTNLDELVTRADCVVRSEVLSVRCEARGQGRERHIVTLVRIHVERTLVGDAASEMELEFLGGKVGSEGMIVHGQPVFTPGDRDILFIRGNTASLCPLLNVHYGRYWLVPSVDGKSEIVARANGEPLVSIAQISQPAEAADRAGELKTVTGSSAAPAAPLSLAEFETQIISRAGALRQAPTPNQN